MKEEAPTDDELMYGRMDVRADYFSGIANKAKDRGGLTKMELCDYELLRIDQDRDREYWASLLRSEGHYVNLMDSTVNSLRTGIRVNAHGSGRARVDIYGDIGAQFGGTTADDLRRAFMEVPGSEPIDLHVHSDGGDFSEGVAMNSLVASRAGNTFGYVDGRACSAATFPLMACASITMSVGARMMIHQASASLATGEAADFERAAQLLRETNDAIAAIYMPRWKGSKASLVAALDAETWFTPEQCIAAGLADLIGNDIAIAASVSRRHQYKNIPAPLTIAARAEDCPLLLAAGLMMHRCAIVR